MEDVVITYAAQGAYTVAVLTVGYLWRSLKAARNDNALIKDGVRSLLRDRLIHKCEKCIAGGYCTTDYYNEIRAMYVDYHALGGNGTVTRLMNQVEELPHVPPEKDNG